jgi:hypothetical protein
VKVHTLPSLMTEAWVVEKVCGALRELADADFQRRVWAAEDPQGETSSFEECVEALFSDSGISVDLDAGREVFGAPVDDELRAISRLVERVGWQRAPDEIIGDPVMQQLRERAARVLAALEEEHR